MHVSHESPADTEERLRRVASAAEVDVLPGAWWYEEFPSIPFPACMRADAIALVRDQASWCQLVPVRPGDQPRERFRIWSIHFPEGVDNSGFIGWLAARIKASTGSGMLVVCGQNRRRGGIYDYGGCPMEAADAVLAELRALTARAEPGNGGTEHEAAVF